MTQADILPSIHDTVHSSSLRWLLDDSMYNRYLYESMVMYNMILFFTPIAGFIMSWQDDPQVPYPSKPTVLAVGL